MKALGRRAIIVSTICLPVITMLAMSYPKSPQDAMAQQPSPPKESKPSKESKEAAITSTEAAVAAEAAAARASLKLNKSTLEPAPTRSTILSLEEEQDRIRRLLMEARLMTPEEYREKQKTDPSYAAPNLGIREYRLAKRLAQLMKTTPEQWDAIRMRSSYAKPVPPPSDLPPPPPADAPTSAQLERLYQTTPDEDTPPKKKVEAQ